MAHLLKVRMVSGFQPLLRLLGLCLAWLLRRPWRSGPRANRHWAGLAKKPTRPVTLDVLQQRWDSTKRSSQQPGHTKVELICSHSAVPVTRSITNRVPLLPVAGGYSLHTCVVPMPPLSGAGFCDAENRACLSSAAWRHDWGTGTYSPTGPRAQRRDCGTGTHRTISLLHCHAVAQRNCTNGTASLRTTSSLSIALPCNSPSTTNKPLAGHMSDGAWTLRPTSARLRCNPEPWPKNNLRLLHDVSKRSMACVDQHANNMYCMVFQPELAAEQAKYG